MLLSQKQEAVEELRTELGGAASILLTNMTGVPVEKVNELRSLFRAKGVNYKVAKNTLVKRALADTPAEAMNELLVGPTALAWHDEEPAVPAKILKDFLKDYKKLEVKGGYIDGDIMKGDAALALADMPSKDQLRAQILGLVKLVPGKFLSLMQTPQRQFLGVLSAYKTKLEEDGDA